MMAFQYGLNNPHRHLGILGQDDNGYEGSYGSMGDPSESETAAAESGGWADTGWVSEAAEYDAWSEAMAEAQSAMQTETEEAALGLAIAESLSEAWTPFDFPSWVTTLPSWAYATPEAAAPVSSKPSIGWSIAKGMATIAGFLTGTGPVFGVAVSLAQEISSRVAFSTGIPASTIQSNLSQNMDIIGAKMDYADAQSRGDAEGMQAAASKATSARQAGGSISSSTPLDQNLIDAYNMYSQAQTQTQLASLASGKIFGIPTWIIFAGLGVGLIFGGKTKRRRR